jgi:hypothetical protein
MPAACVLLPLSLLLLRQAQRMLQWTWTSHTAAQHHCLA